MWQSQDIYFAGDHPAAAGHFPDHPIVPGALLLDAVIAAIAGTAAHVTVRTTKFLQPIDFGAHVSLRWQALHGQAAFECRLAGQENLAMSGKLEIAPLP
jgi:3-hydroxymyristoyl/3-hydroxydecanoyl-(acyl carrier protein) dehydratase